MKLEHRFVRRRVPSFLCMAVCLLAGVSAARASFHLMQIEQVIGGVNGDTTAQAVQLRMRSGGQGFVGGTKLVVYDAAGDNPVTLLTFPSNVSNGAGVRILVTTANFASHEASPIASDFTMMNSIPASYLAAGRLAFQSGNTIYWSLSWGGSSYTGSNAGAFDNDGDGNFGPSFAGALPSSSMAALRFSGNVSAPSTNNAADYARTSGAAIFANNAGAAATLAKATPARIAPGLVRVELQTVATGLEAPVELATANDGTGRLFIAEQPGRIRIVKSGALVSNPFLNLEARIINGGERGLLGLAFHPGFSSAASPGFRKFYTYTTEPVSDPNSADFTVPISGSFNNQTVVAEWQVSASDPDVADPASRREVMRINHPQENHNGGKIAFRPSDGYLYIATGDGGASNDAGNGHTPDLGNAQDTSSVLGKILRIDPLAPALQPASTDPVSANGKYRVPASNPFVGAPGVDEIYAYGFRNPYRFSFDAVADDLIVGDVGQNAIEEVDLVAAGKNYGWNRKEGSFLFNPSDGSIAADPNPDPSLVDPVAEYGHEDGISVIGGFIYHGAGVPALAGKYVFGDFLDPATGSGRLFYSDLPTGVIDGLGLGANPRALGSVIKGFGQDAGGEIYVLADSGTSGGQVRKIVPIPAVPALLNLSTRLRVEMGDNALIGGFILTGSAPKKIVLRAIGPSLSAKGQPVPGRLENPTLALVDREGDEITSNDDWMMGPQAQEIEDLEIAPSSSLESALLASLAPGAYTAIVRGVAEGSGVGLVELYDVEHSVPANAVNISTRGRVQTGDDVMIGGFIIGGTQPQRVIVRAIGPSLTARGVPDALQNPALELVDSSGALLASNDDWRSDQESAINGTGVAPADDNESAILRTLPPGNYTAIVRGVDNSTGVALVEIFRLAP